MFKPVDEQLAYIEKGAVEIIQKEELRAKLSRSIREGKPLRVKAGFDPTAPDIHLGHTVLLRKMKHFQDLGHEVIFLIGDFTGLIGDPSGRSAVRPAMTREEIHRNAETYKAQIFKILSPERTIIDFNSRWLGALTSFDIINLTAKYTMARLLERDDFSERLKNGVPISVHEILYPLMQAYDSVALRADVELGGTDQKFNLLVGREIQREFNQEPQVVLTMPLLEGLDGVEKMSKSLANYVGITEPPKEIYGKIMSISDSLMYRYYELLTDIPSAKIEAWRRRAAEGRVNPRDLKAQLAGMIVTDFWGASSAAGAAADFDRVHRHKEVPADIDENVVEVSISEMAGSRGKERLGRNGATAYKPTLSIEFIDLLVNKRIFLSRGEAKRVIRQGGVYLDGERVEDIAFRLSSAEKGDHILKVGKRKFYKIRLRD
ncbi:MAG: tyrosine--tRNA ligase [Candidatus Aminicenantes bacterium]|nr:tyrosine--tRNA ligase [Candidatus Aminicenantes bacterium]